MIADSIGSDQIQVVHNPKYYDAPLIFEILQWLVRILLHSLFKIEVRGLENLPKTGGYILAGNHLSWIDPFLMLIGAPASPHIHFIAAREEVERPAWRKFMTTHVGGVIPVDRGKRTNLREIAALADEVLQGGGVLGVFPEGDVSGYETGKLLPLKKGMGYFAAQTGAAIVPVAFAGTKELWLRKHIIMVIGPTIVGRKGGKAVIEAQTQATAAAILAIMPKPPQQNPRNRLYFKRFFTELFTQEQIDHPTPE